MTNMLLHGRYRTFGVTNTPIAPDAFLVESRLSGYRTTLRGSELQLLLSCDSSRTLSLHAQDAVWKAMCDTLRRQRGLRGAASRFLARRLLNDPESLPIASAKVRHVYKRLEQWAMDGLLISDSQLQEALAGTSGVADASKRRPSSAKIEVIGIPTAERTAELERCMSSLIESLLRHNRSPDIIVIDDSRDPQVRAENYRLLHRLGSAYSGGLYSMNREQRAKFAKVVAIRAGVNEKIAEFALMGHPGCNRSEGGCRNAILLLSQGKLALQTDDDTICRVGCPPAFEEGLALTSAVSSDAYWFFNSFDEAVRAVRFVDHDVLGVHESVLGRTPNELIGDELRSHDGPVLTDGMEASFLDKLGHGDRKVRMSLLGPVGDTCLNNDLRRLFLVGESFERLIQPADSYHRRLSTRQVARCVTRWTLSERLRCIGMNFAVDNRELLPPFMPVQARCDGIFGDLLNVCFPDAFAAHLPHVLAHRPPDDRCPTVDDVFERLRGVRANDIVSALIYELSGWPHGPRPEDRLRTVGMFMINLASSAPRDFESNVRRIVAAQRYKSIRMAKHHLSRHNGPGYWKNDVTRFIKIMAQSVVESDLSAPVDVRGPRGERQPISKDLVGRFGELLLHWPALYYAMEELSAEDIRRHLTKHEASHSSLVCD